MGSYPNFLEGRIQEFTGRQGKRDCNSDFFLVVVCICSFFNVKLHFYHVFALFHVLVYEPINLHIYLIVIRVHSYG